MIVECIDLLQTNVFYGFSNNVEIAKGKYEIPTTWQIVKNKIVRKWHTKKK